MTKLTVPELAEDYQYRLHKKDILKKKKKKLHKLRHEHRPTKRRNVGLLKVQEETGISARCGLTFFKVNT